MAGELSSVSRRQRSRLTTSATINVTSLLDIMMVLLISFMIVTPAFQSGVEVNLPEVETETIKTQDKALVITISYDQSSKSAKIYLGETLTNIDDLEDTLQAERGKRADTGLVVQGDKMVPWNEMAQVLGVIQAAGIEKISLATIPPRSER